MSSNTAIRTASPSRIGYGVLLTLLALCGAGPGSGNMQAQDVLRGAPVQGSDSTHLPLPSPSAPPVRLDLPLLDAPYNLRHGGRGPSMAQSLALTTSFYDGAHAGIERAFGTRRRLARLATFAFDWITVAEVPLPLAEAWLHEEYHRAVLGARGIGSYNDVYKVAVGAEAIYVSQVRDEDLVRLKRDHPADQVRLGIAGIEGEYQMIQSLQQRQFFRGTRGWHLPLYWLTKLSSALYVYSGSLDETNTDTDASNAADGADILRRDFTGHDFTAWAYDLHRPDEPYAARGVHPSGVGIDRYIKPSDLTNEERAYLKRQGERQFLNLLDPQLLGIRGFTVRNPVGGAPVRVNVSAGHVLTAFGHTVDANLLARQGETNLIVVLHRYANGERAFPGADVQVVDQPVNVGGRALQVSPRMALWLQPEAQRFRARNAVPGGLVGLRVGTGATGGRFGAFAEIEAKSAGWVAGVVQLERAINSRAGISARLW